MTSIPLELTLTHFYSDVIDLSWHCRSLLWDSGSVAWLNVVGH